MGSKITFQKIPNPTNNVEVLGSLIFDKRSTLGQKAYIDLRNTTEYLLLARDLIAALNEHSSPSEIASDYTIGSYSQAIHFFLKYCSIVKLPVRFRMLEIDSELLLKYRAYVQLACAEFKSKKSRRLFGNLIRLLHAGQTVGLAHPNLQFPRNFRQITDSDPIQPYCSSEALNIENACRNHIRALEARLKDGEKLLLEGRDPESEVKAGSCFPRPTNELPWNQLPNLLWYVVNRMEGKYMKEKELTLNKHSAFKKSVSGYYGGIYRRKDVYSYLYPLSNDLIPFIILLAKYTGRNETSIFELRRDCLKEFEGRYFLSYTKERSRARIYQKAISDDARFSPVNLIKTLLRITDPLVRYASLADQDKLFLGLTTTPKELEPVKQLDSCYIKFLMNKNGGWCDQNALIDDHGKPLKISLRRMRVYYLTNKYMANGQLSKISRDAAHVLGDTTVGYINNDSTKHIHEKAIENGIQSALSIARPTVLTVESLQEATHVLRTNETVASKILRGDQDVFFASCKDFYNRPDGQPNMPCDKPWGCFTCSNAIITQHVLPRVITFKNFIAQQKTELASEDWNAKFGNVWDVLINDILPKFSIDAIAEAELYASNETLYIPLSLKA